MTTITDSHDDSTMHERSTHELESPLQPDFFVPESFVCPILQVTMRNPVILVQDGHSYERSAIEHWFLRSEHKLSPMTGVNLSSRFREGRHTLVPNHALRKAIEEFMENAPPALRHEWNTSFVANMYNKDSSALSEPPDGRRNRGQEDYDAARQIEQKVAARWSKLQEYLTKGDRLDDRGKSLAVRSVEHKIAKSDPKFHSAVEKVIRADVDGETAYNNMLEWLRLLDADFQNVTRPDQAEFSDSEQEDVKENEQGDAGHGEVSFDLGGLVATQDVKRGATVCCIPSTCIIFNETAAESPLGQRLKQTQLRSSHSRMAAFLLEQRADPSSYWKNYLDLLVQPSEYDKLPIFYSQELLQELEGSAALRRISDRRQSLVADYDAICADIPEFSEIATVEDFVWARTVVITRIFGLLRHGVKTSALVPLVDTINDCKIHGFDNRNVKWTYDDATDGFVVTALEDIHENSPIMLSFGQKSQVRWFVNYGGTVNPFRNIKHNTIEIHVPIAADLIQDGHNKLRLINHHDFDTNEILKLGYMEDRDENGSVQQSQQQPQQQQQLYFVLCVLTHGKNDSIEHLLKLCRFVTADVAKTEFLERNDVSYDAEHELTSLRMAATLLEKAASAFGTTFEQDVSDLSSGKYNDDIHMYNILRMRISEKGALKHFSELLRICLSLHELRTNATLRSTKYIRKLIVQEARYDTMGYCGR